MRGAPNQRYEDWVHSDSWTKGQQSETSFGDLLREKYPEARRATKEEQFKGMDWICSKGSIDVKAMKSIERGGRPQSEFIWVEFKNNAGNDGWLHGEMDWIAFEEPSRYVIVKRIDLLNFCLRACDLDSRAKAAKDALYKGYNRKNRKDLISMIRKSDLNKLPTQEIQKWRTSTSTTQGTLSS